MDLSKWMGNLSDRTKNLPIIDLAIPGSHDTMSYTCDPVNGFSPDVDPAVVKLRGYFIALTAYETSFEILKTVHQWCVTQDMELMQQLRSGIRYLDFRVFKRWDGEYFFCHALAGDKVSDHLPVINNFLEENEEEVVICDFQHLYGFKEEDHFQFINKYIRPVFGEKMCPLINPPRRTVTLNWMLPRGYRVIVIYRHKNIEKLHLWGIWPGWLFITHWPETNDIDEMRTFIDDKISNRDMDRGLITQMILTPNAMDVVLNPSSTLKYYFANLENDQMRDWLDSKRPGEYQGQVNVIIGDFVDPEKFIKHILKLNEFLEEETKNFDPDTPPEE